MRPNDSQIEDTIRAFAVEAGRWPKTGEVHALLPEAHYKKIQRILRKVKAGGTIQVEVPEESKRIISMLEEEPKPKGAKRSDWDLHDLAMSRIRKLKNTTDPKELKSLTDLLKFAAAERKRLTKDVAVEKLATKTPAADLVAQYHKRKKA